MFPGPGVRRLQLWSDDRGKEFAVRLSNEHDFRAVSNPAAKYTKLVEESDYFSDMKYDWEFLLDHWAGMKNKGIEPFNLNGKEEPSPATLSDLTDFQIAPVKAGERRAKREKPKPLLKCHYCTLSYNSEKERQEHELVWHSEKMRKDSNQANNKPN